VTVVNVVNVSALERTSSPMEDPAGVHEPWLVGVSQSGGRLHHLGKVLPHGFPGFDEI
jgi:hypothetical protein